jgi:hypothetical protein
MKPVKAWAVLGSDGELAIWDYRLPITWLRHMAVGDKADYLARTGRIVRVEIREVPKKRREP